MGKQIPVEEKNEKVGGRDNQAAVLKGVLVRMARWQETKTYSARVQRGLFDGTGTQLKEVGADIGSWGTAPSFSHSPLSHHMGLMWSWVAWSLGVGGGALQLLVVLQLGDRGLSNRCVSSRDS